MVFPRRADPRRTPVAVLEDDESPDSPQRWGHTFRTNPGQYRKEIHCLLVGIPLELDVHSLTVASRHFRAIPLRNNKRPPKG